jgi:NAD(P)-dependent dehydrogenase (short-subunit alcohol dehydrogenase family)
LYIWISYFVLVSDFELRISDFPFVFAPFSPMQLSQKIALITGGTLGIGAATALELARRGCEIAVCARNIDQRASELRKKIEVLGRRCLMLQADLSQGADCRRVVQQTVEQLGNLHVLIHNAGGPAFGRLEDLTEEQWDQALALHVTANFHLCKAALPTMRQNKEGAIITVSSTAGIRGVPGAIVYATAKGALPQFTRSLARDVADDNIRVNCIAPGIIRTRFHETMTEERKQLNIQHRIPLHREGTPEQVAEAIALLVENDYITGETLVIDGGLTSRIV